MNSTAAIAHRALAPLDMAIIGVYFLIVFCIGLYFARKERTSTDYFLASRDVGWFSAGHFSRDWQRLTIGVSAPAAARPGRLSPRKRWPFRLP